MQQRVPQQVFTPRASAWGMQQEKGAAIYWCRQTPSPCVYHPMSVLVNQATDWLLTRLIQTGIDALYVLLVIITFHCFNYIFHFCSTYPHRTQFASLTALGLFEGQHIPRRHQVTNDTCRLSAAHQPRLEDSGKQFSTDSPVLLVKLRVQQTRPTEARTVQPLVPTLWVSMCGVLL